MNAKNIKGFLVGAIVVASSLSVLAGSITLTVPFTFAAGKPIKASDLNANFGAVKKTLDNHNHVGETWNGSTAGLIATTQSGYAGLWGMNTGNYYGVRGDASKAGSIGVLGVNLTGIGVRGETTYGYGGSFRSVYNHGVSGVSSGVQTGGVFGLNDKGVGVWGKSEFGNGGYFETNSNTAPSLAIRQFGRHHLIDAYGRPR